MNNLRIRKLTPKECWRLMGFDDSDFEKAAKINSNTQLYKQAGNSIVVNVLEAILTNLLLNNEQTTNPDVIEGQTNIYDFIELAEKMELNKEEIQKLLFCIDLVIQNFGDNEGLERIYEKLLKIKEAS